MSSVESGADKGASPEDRGQDTGPGSAVHDEERADEGEEQTGVEEMGEDQPGKSEDGGSTEQSAGRKGYGGARGESGSDGGEIGHEGLEDGVGEERWGRGTRPVEEEDNEGEEERDGIAEERGCGEAEERPGGEDEPGGVPVVGPGEDAGGAGGDGEQRFEADEGVDEDDGNVQGHRVTGLMTLALTAHAFYSLLGAAANAVLAPFDASGGGVGQRWDVVHFADIAAHGYRWEHEYAFLPGAPLLVKYLSPLAINVVNGVLAWDTARTLLSLSRAHVGIEVGRLGTALSLLPLSAATQHIATGYSEPLFRWLSYRGMLCCARRQWQRATLCFTAATLLRSNGVFLAGFVVWGCFRRHRVQACVASALIVLPFVAHNYRAYDNFCRSPAPPPWCHSTLPLVYPYVQAVYWNVGLFNYWQLAQLPNLLVALPPLYAVAVYAWRYLFHWLTFSLPPSPFFSPSVAPHALHALFMSLILLFASHSQIVLRLAPSMPFTYWAIAYILVHPRRHPWASTFWIPCAFIWSLLSVILWVAFLPPA